MQDLELNLSRQSAHLRRRLCDKLNSRKDAVNDFNQRSMGGDVRNPHVSGPPRRADISQAGPGSFVAPHQRLGHRSSWMDHVGRIPRLGGELCVPFRNAEEPASKTDGPVRACNTPDLRNWRCRCRHLYHGPDAFSSSFIDEGYPSHPLRYQPIGAAPLCGPAHWPESSPHESSMGKGAQTFALGGLVALVRLRQLCRVHKSVCCSHGPARLWPWGQHWLASAVCVLHLHAVDRDRGIASNQVQSSAFCRRLFTG